MSSLHPTPPVTFIFFAIGEDGGGEKLYRGRSILLQGDIVLSDVSSWPNGLVQVQDNGFRPEIITIEAERSVIWLNCYEDEIQVSGDGWTTGVIPANSSAGVAFTVPGIYAYHDEGLSGLSGTIIVTEAPKRIFIPVIFH